MMTCNLMHRNKLSVSKGSKLSTHLRKRALDTNSTSLQASKLTRRIHSPSIPFFHWPGTTLGATMAFSLSHTHALVLLEEEVANAN